MADVANLNPKRITISRDRGGLASPAALICIIPTLAAKSQRGAVPTRGNRSASRSSRNIQVKPKIDAGRSNRAASKARNRRGRLSSDAKARKARLAAKMKRITRMQNVEPESDNEDDDKFFTLPQGAPQPTKVFNEEFKNKDLEYESEVIKDSRINTDGKREYLVKWVGWTSRANTWESEANLRNSLDLIAEFDKKHPPRHRDGERRTD